MVEQASHSELKCASAALLAPLMLESFVLCLILWRTAHQLYWRSHPRRSVLHLVRFSNIRFQRSFLGSNCNEMTQVLLGSCGLRFVFWLGMCHSSLLLLGMACLWWSNSMVLICTAAVIFQWSSAVMAGRVTAQELHRSKRITVLHPLVFLHSLHFIGTTTMALYMLCHGLDPSSSIQVYLDDTDSLLLTYRVINTITLAFDALVACYVAMQLRERLLAAAMADDMKKKSVMQMSLLMTLLTASLALQIVMDVPIFIAGIKNSWLSLSFEVFCIIKYLVPSLLLSLAFLYIMRHIEQREPARMVVVSSRSLVDFVECSSPDCVWCAHHRRYHLNQSKWDVTLMTSFSPRTVDSSYHSSTHANLSQGSWSSDNTDESLPAIPHPSRHTHHRLHQASPSHHETYPAHGHMQFPTYTHGDYEPPQEIPERHGVCYS